MDCCQQCVSFALHNEWSHLIILQCANVYCISKEFGLIPLNITFLLHFVGSLFFAPCRLFFFCTLISEDQLELAGASGIDKD